MERSAEAGVTSVSAMYATTTSNTLFSRRGRAGPSFLQGNCWFCYLVVAIVDSGSRTSGMSAFAKKKSAYDPTRQWGLKPDVDGSTSGATYVVSGHIISDRKDSSGLFINESMGRDAQAKAARKLSAQDADEALKKLLKRDKEGTKAVKAARIFHKKMEKEKEIEASLGLNERRKGKSKEENVTQKRRSNENLSDDASDEDTEKQPKKAYSTKLVRSIGFDPTAKDGRRVKDSDIQKKVSSY